MKQKRNSSLLWLIATALLLTSCTAPTYLSGPTFQYPIIENIGTFGIQNIDEKAEVENDTLTCHYDGFDVTYKVMTNFKISMIISNNSNKNLIIDKSKSFVLYDGYSTQLFKDVRSSRSTTFNNVQDTINNVLTNEAGVSMTIPPFSKWELPLEETNVRVIKRLPDFITTSGTHTIIPFNEQETVEFIIPYSYDNSLAKWETCRNRVYVNSIEVKTGYTTKPYLVGTPRFISFQQYNVIHHNGQPDYSEANRIDAINRKRFKKHKTQVIRCYNPDHIPPQYGNGGNF